MTSHRVGIALVGTGVPIVAPGQPAFCAGPTGASLIVVSVPSSQARAEEAPPSSNESAVVIVANVR